MKFAIVLNKKSPLPAQLNATGHLSLGMPKLLGEDAMKLRSFFDAQKIHASELTDFPLIVLAAKNGNQLKTAHSLALEEDIPCNAFFECYLENSPEEQEEMVRAGAIAEQNYVALCLFGSDEVLRPLTRKFSLY